MLLQYLPEDRTTSHISVIFFDQAKQPKFQEKVKFIFEEQAIEYESGDIQHLQTFASNRTLLETLLKEENKIKISVCAHEVSLDIASFCISHFKKLNFFIRKNVFDFNQLELNRFMRLDFPVYKALDLINTVSKPNQGPKGKNQDVKTLLDCLDTCKTKPGHKTLRRWISQPLAIQEQIETRLTVVEFLVDNTAFRNYLKNTFLAVMPDLESISVKFFKMKTEIRSNAANLYDAIKIYNVSKHIETLCAFFKSYTLKETDKEIVEAYFIAPIKNAMLSLEKFQAYVEKTIDLTTFAQTHELQLHSTTSPEMAELHAKLATINTQLNQERLRMEKLLGLPVGLERTPKSPVMLQTSKKAAATLAKHPELQIKTVRAHQLRFTSPTSNTLSTQLLQTQDALQALQASHTTHILQILASYYPVVEDLAEVVAEIDAFVALADFSALPGRCRPAFNDGARICLISAVHPVLESRMGRIEVIPNDCFMKATDSGFVVVTGPNMGGKSTYLRQVALNIILAQIGCFVCASAASLPVFTGMVARIGAGDIQSRGVSTWMAELLEVSCMLQFSSHNTFLLIDELGRGTSTAEGVGMTWALAEHILDKMKCFCLFATHFFELTKLAHVYSQVQNCHVDFSLVDEIRIEGTSAMKLEGPYLSENTAEQVSNRIKLNYRILPGATDSAFGVQILHMMKFPSEIITFAQKNTDDQNKTIVKSEKSQIQPEIPHQISLDEKIEILLMARKIRKQMQAGHSQQSEGEERLKQSLEQLLSRNRPQSASSSHMTLEKC